jgi:hypothetical protein
MHHYSLPDRSVLLILDANCFTNQSPKIAKDDQPSQVGRKKPVLCFRCQNKKRDSSPVGPLPRCLVWGGVYLVEASAGLSALDSLSCLADLFALWLGFDAVSVGAVVAPLGSETLTTLSVDAVATVGAWAKEATARPESKAVAIMDLISNMAIFTLKTNNRSWLRLLQASQKYF